MSTPDDCLYLHNGIQMNISLFLIVGMIISYLPQHIKIISNKTSDGISPYFLLLGTSSAVGSIVNIFITQKRKLVCCPTLTLGLCIESLLGIAQITAQGILFFIIFVLYFIYFPEERKLAPYVPRIGLPPAKYSEDWMQSLRVLWIVSTHIIISFIITLTLLLLGDSWFSLALLWAGFNGLFSMTLALFQYVPQIIETWKRKDCGALSIPTMLIQTPGTFLFVYSLYTREDTNWTTWMTYLVTGVLQGCLLCICLLFQYQQNRSNTSSFGPVYIGNVQNAAPRRSARDSEYQAGSSSNDGSETVSENEPLLLNNHNPEATYEYRQAPHQRTKTLLSKWKRGQAGSKLHLVHHSLAANLSERDDTLL